MRHGTAAGTRARDAPECSPERARRSTTARWSPPSPVPMAAPWRGPAVPPSVRARTTWSRGLSTGSRRVVAARPDHPRTGRHGLAARSSGGSSGRIATAVPETYPGQPLAAPMGLEAELAERLDTVLGIAGRLAASHDRRELFRMIVDETKRVLRADATTIRILRDDRLEIDRLGGHPRRRRRRSCRTSAATRAGSARSCGPARCWPCRTSARTPTTGSSATRASRGRRPPDRAAHPPRPGHRRAVGGHPRAARLDERRRRLHHDPRDPCRDRPRQRRAVRADRGAGRPARGPPGGLGAAEPRRRRSRRSGGRSSRRPRRIIDYHNARVYLVEAARRRRPDRVRGHGRRLRAGRPRAPALPARRGLHRLGRRARRADPRQRREPRSARRDDPRDRRRRRVDARRPDALRRA